MSTENPGFVISYVKATSMLGEQITVNTSLPIDASEADLSALFIKIGNALDNRMRAMNEEVLKRTGKTLAQLDVEPGTVYVKPEEE